MVDISDLSKKLKNVRTLEDIVNILAILFNNMNTISQNYYDIFLNSTPMYVPVKLYDENGGLVSREIPNVATFKVAVKTGTIDPNGVQDGKLGDFYLNTDSQDIFYKANDSIANQGWLKVIDENDGYLKEDGNAIGLYNLDVSKAGAGPLAVQFGGTGNTAASLFEGIVKANGTNPYTMAEEGTDYMGPNNLRGTCSYYAGYIEDYVEGGVHEPLSGWLVCNGAELSINEYRPLYNVIKTMYGGDGENTFKLPNLIGSYIKGGAVTSAESNDIVEDTVGGHTHDLTGSTGSGSAHRHDPGDYDIRGMAGTSWMSKGSLKNPTLQMNGCFFKVPSGKYPTWKKDSSSPPAPTFYESKSYKYYGVNDGSTSNNDPGMGFMASLNWTGHTGYESSHTHTLNNLSTLSNNENAENDVKHISMIPIIKY